MDIQTRTNTPTLRQVKLKDLLDHHGAAKAVESEAKKASESIKDEILRRLSSKANLTNTVVREGNLFRTTVTYSESTRLNMDKIRDDFEPKVLRKYEYTTTQYTVRTTSKTGKKDT